MSSSESVSAVLSSYTMEIKELEGKMKELKGEIETQLNKEREKRDEDLIQIVKEQLKDCYLRIQILSLKKEMQELKGEIETQLNKEEGKSDQDLIRIAKEQLNSLNARYIALNRSIPFDVPTYKVQVQRTKQQPNEEEIIDFVECGWNFMSSFV
jgi:hypothetical protein